MAASPLPLVDTHCHLADPRMRDDTAEVIARAQEAGARFLISVGAIGTIECDQATVAIAERNANVYAAVGVHPHDAKDCDKNRLAELRALARSSKVVAIGESGLDFHYMHSPAETQENSLLRHLELAAELELPIVIHCREAEERVAAIVRAFSLPPRGGAIHSFTGNAEAARAFIALGFHISFSGILTFKNAKALREAAIVVPDDRLLIETDSPYLAPEPYRGKRNEPAYVARTLETLAHVRSTDAIALGETIIANAARLFRINPNCCDQ
ncbi:MAG: TatD family hydrolase [Candidatus Binataceae bacterium]